MPAVALQCVDRRQLVADRVAIALVAEVVEGQAPDALAYVDFDGARALSAAQQVPVDQELDRAFLELYCPNVAQAAAALANWLKKLK